MAQGILCVDIGTNLIKFCLLCNNEIVLIEKIPACMIFRTTHDDVTNKITLDSNEILLETYNPRTDIIAKDMIQLMYLKYSEYMSNIHYTPLTVNKDENDCLTITINNRQYYPEEIAAKFIESIAIKLSQQFNVDIRDLVLTNDDCHDANRANSLSANAGLNLIKHVSNWKTIIELYLNRKHIHDQEELNLVIVDLGCTALKMYYICLKGKEVVSVETAKNQTWSSYEFTTHLYNHILQKNMYPKGFKHLSDEDKAIIENQCDIAKAVLSNDTTFQCNWKDWNCVLSRNDFDRCTSQTVKRLIAEIKIFLRLNNIDKSKVSDIIVVGGSANIPEVKLKIEQFFGMDIYKLDIKPEYVIVNGLAKCFMQESLRN